MIVALFPELSAAGGVQRAGRLTAAVLASFAQRRGEAWRFLSLNDPQGRREIEVGGRTIRFAGFGRSKLRFSVAALSAALEQPALVVAFHPHLAPVAAPMRIFAPGMRSAVFAHGIEVWRPLGPVRCRALRRSDLLVAPSSDTARHLAEQQGTDPRKIRKLAWSLGPEFVAAECPAARAGADAGEDGRPANFPRGRIVLTVGRWDAQEAYKGVDHLIQALPALAVRVPDVQLVAIGGGSDLPRLEMLARAAGVADRTHFLPRLAPEDLRAAYRASDVFALPSKGEGFGLVFIEAMAQGTPVIGGAHGGTPDVIEDGAEGYLVRHGEVPQLAARLEALLCDPALRERMGARARERVWREFLFERFERELEGLLAVLMDGPAGHARG